MSQPLFKKTVPLTVVASNMGDEFESALYSGIARKTVYGLEDGGDLDEVVQHYLEHDGMADDYQRLSKIRLQITLAADLSGSMFRVENGRPIVPAMAMMRMFQRAFKQTQEHLAPGVLNYSMWCWSAGVIGGETICLNDLSMGSLIPEEYQERPELFGVPMPLSMIEIDQFFEGIAAVKPTFRGTGTQLIPLISGLRKWEENHGDPGAYRLDVIVSDGKLYEDDVKKCSLAQVERRAGGKYEGVILQIGPDKTLVPEGLTMIKCKPQQLDVIMRDILLGFVQKVL